MANQSARMGRLSRYAKRWAVAFGLNLALFTSVLTVCSKTVLSTERRELQVPDQYYSQNGVLHLKVQAVTTTSTIDGKSYQEMMIYKTSLVNHQGTFVKGTASTYVGPEWHLKPGDRLIVDYINALPNYKFSDVQGHTEDLPQPINLHTHGLIVSPAGNGDNILLSIPPGRSNQYVIDIPKTQHEGLYWYHPHIHGLTDDQVYGGLAGQIVIGRADGNYRQFDGLDVKSMMIRYHVQKPGERGELVDASAYNSHGTALIRDGGAMLYTVNGLVNPATRLNAAIPNENRPSESQVWAFTNITGSASYILGLEEVDATDSDKPDVVGKPVDMTIVSVDGSPLRQPIILAGERAKQGYHLPQGGRVAILVQGASDPTKVIRLMQLQNRSGSGDRSAYDWSNQKYGGGWRDYTRDILLTTYTDKTTPTRHVESPSTLTPNNPVAIQSLQGRPVDHSRTFYFNDVARPTPATPNEFPANFGIFPNNRVDQPKAGTVEEWTILNYSSLTHPFHVHTQYGEVQQIEAPTNPAVNPDILPPDSKTGQPYRTLQYVTEMGQAAPLSFTQDVIGVPPAKIDPQGNPIFLEDGVTPSHPGKVVLRVSFVDYLGTYVEHCHRLPHEDRGMMSLVRTIPRDPVLAVAGQSGTVRVVRSSNFSDVAILKPFPNFQGHLKTAVGDVDGDAVPDVAVSGSNQIWVYSGSLGYLNTLMKVTAFGSMTSSASVALTDLNGDARDEIILGEGKGGQSRVKIIDGVSNAELSQFQPYESGFKGGVNVAAGMIEEGGRNSLLVAPGAGRAPEVKMYNVDLFGDAAGTFPDFHARLNPVEVAKFLGADASYQGGLSISTGSPFAPKGGFASILVSPLASPLNKSTMLKLFRVVGGDDHGGQVTASGVHRATAYSPSTPRMVHPITSVDLGSLAFRAGAVVGAYSTVEGAIIVAIPTQGGEMTRWGLTPNGEGLQFIDQKTVTGNFVAGM